MGQFDRLNHEIGILKNANELHKEKVNMVQTDNAIYQELNSKQEELIRIKENKLMVAEQKASDYKNETEELMKAVRQHDFKNCECKWTLLPEVKKAFEKGDRFKLGPRAPGVVDKLRNERDEYKEDVKKLEERVERLQKENDKLNDNEDN